MGPMNMAEPLNDSTVMDDVRNPPCTDYPKPADCFKDDRAEVHLHGGNTPWISDGTPHQWITPANEDTPWPQGVSVKDVPGHDRHGPSRRVPDCGAAMTAARPSTTPTSRAPG